MGCCQSRLLETGSVSNKYEENPVEQNQEYLPSKKDLALIVPAHNTDRLSVLTLELKLGEVISEWEGRRGKITYTCLSARRSECELAGQRQSKQKTVRIVCGNSISKSDLLSLDDDNESNESNDEAECRVSKVLTSNSIVSHKRVEQQLFYINSSEVGATKLKNWADKNRTSIALTEQNCLSAIRKCSSQESVVSLLTIYLFQMNQEMQLISYKKCADGQYGVRIFYNGIKRMLSIGAQDIEQPAEIVNYFCRAIVHKKPHYACFTIYYLTGWIPEILNLEMIQDKSDIFKRLITNFQASKLLISLMSKDNQRYYILKGVNLEKESIDVICPTRLLSGEKMSECLETKEWKQIINLCPIMNINWNPCLYCFTKRAEGLLKINQKNQASFPHFLLRLPPSKSDMEIRIMVERHCIESPDNFECFSLNLYDFERRKGFQDGGSSLVRVASLSDSKIVSEIFIFESSIEESYYILAITPAPLSKQNHFTEQQFTITTYSFVDVSIKLYENQSHKSSFELTAAIHSHHMGLGLNSPLFRNNLHFSLQIPRQSLCRLEVEAIAESQFDYQLMLVPDVEKCADISLIRTQTFANELIQSDEFQDNGYFQFENKYENYILILACYSSVEGAIKIRSQCWTMQSARFSDQQVKNSIRQIKYEPKMMKQVSFEWKMSNPGPRKRLKSNSEPITYSVSVFAEFFKNPFVEYALPQGRYQISIFSKTYFNYFLSPESGSLKQKSQLAEPPSISLGVFLLSSDKKSCRIIIDDTFYVPFGFGYYSPLVDLESGLYRFVLPKIEKQKGVGTLQIRQFNNY